MRKPMVVIPVPNHAEQWVNAMTVKDLAVGIISDDAGLEDAICTLVRSVERFVEGYRKLPETGEGALQAAHEILSRAN